MITLLRRSPHEPQLLAQVQRTLLPKFEAMGWDAKPGESPAELSLRGDLVQLLAMTHHAEVIAEARRRFAQREQDGSGMRGDLATGILMAVGLHASKAQWDALAAMLSDPRYSALEWPLGRALGSARDPDVIRHALETSLTDQLPRSVSSRLPARIAELGGADRTVWDFVQANRSKLFERSSRWGQRFIYPAALQDSRDLALAQEIKDAAQRDLDEETRAETLRTVSLVQRNAWAYDAVSRQLDVVRGAASAPSSSK
jgi:aminopeptidase N